MRGGRPLPVHHGPLLRSLPPAGKETPPNRGRADLRGPPRREVRRISLLRGWVNKALGGRILGHATHSPLLLLWWNGITSSTKTVDKPPSKAADPLHRTRLEAAAMESSLDTFSTPPGVPSKCLPFGEVSGEGRRMPVGPGGPLWPLLPTVTITRPAPAAAGVPRHRSFQHHHRPGAQHRPHASVA